MTLSRVLAPRGAFACVATLTAAVSSLNLAPAALAQCVPAQLAKILAGDGQASDQFGYSVAISSSGATALVGAPFDDDLGSNTGAVYVYTFNGTNWAQQAKLKAGDPQANDQFGVSVAINAAGDRALVGAKFDDDNGTNSGSAYAYQRTGTTWTQQAKIKPLGGAAGDEFGTDVDIDDTGTFAIVGSPFDDFNLILNAGSANLFQFSGAWQELDKLASQPLIANENNGASVALSSGAGVLITGAPLADIGLVTDAGAVYVFGFNGGGYSQFAKLSASDGSASDFFGDAVAINTGGTRILVGAANDDDLGADSGSAYVYVNSGGWTEQAKLLPQNGMAGDQFGFNVALSDVGDRALVGAPLGDGLVPDSGAAYAFLNNGPNWAQLARFQISDGAVGDALGSGVALTDPGDKAFLGAPGQDDMGSDSGAVYLYPTTCQGGPITFFCFGDGSQTTACPCGNFGGPNRGCANSQNGTGALLNAVGVVNPDSVTLTASGELATSASIFLQGDQEIAGGSIFGDGVRCAGGLLLRLYVKIAVGGSVTAPQGGDPSITARSAQLGDTIFPGSTRLYQVYYRDPLLAFCPAPPGNSFNITNGARIVW